MTSIKFCKFHGFGNDYIVIERIALAADVSLPDLARAICDRHTGVGSDGIAVIVRTGRFTPLLPEEGWPKAGVVGGDWVPESGNEKDGMINDDADYSCEIVNPDGSVAGFSGNGTRCAAAYLHYRGLWSDADLRLRTRSGVKNYHLLDSDSPGHYSFRAEIGNPRFSSAYVPFASHEPLDSVIDREVVVGDQAILVSAVNVGNPVACIFVESFDFDWRYVGREMEVHPAFPERANIVFVKVRDRENIELRIWERGAGETAASGTCSAGAAVLAAFTQKTGRNVHVHSEGGTTLVNWRDDDEIIITGRADLAFCGEWP